MKDLRTLSYRLNRVERAMPTPDPSEVDMSAYPGLTMSDVAEFFLAGAHAAVPDWNADTDPSPDPRAMAGGEAALARLRAVAGDVAQVQALRQELYRSIWPDDAGRSEAEPPSKG